MAGGSYVAALSAPVPRTRAHWRGRARVSGGRVTASGSAAWPRDALAAFAEAAAADGGEKLLPRHGAAYLRARRRLERLHLQRFQVQPDLLHDSLPFEWIWMRIPGGCAPDVDAIIRPKKIDNRGSTAAGPCGPRGQWGPACLRAEAPDQPEGGVVHVQRTVAIKLDTPRPRWSAVSRNRYEVPVAGSIERNAIPVGKVCT